MKFWCWLLGHRLVVESRTDKVVYTQCSRCARKVEFRITMFFNPHTCYMGKLHDPHRRNWKKIMQKCRKHSRLP